MDNSLKDIILDRVDIVEVIGERLSLTKKGREFVALCPFHDDKKPSMTVSPAKRIFKCFACGAGGDVIKFVQMYERIGFREALEQLAKRAGLDVQHDPHAQERLKAREALANVTTWAARVFQRNLHESPAGRAAMEYAHRRGLSDETIQRAGIGLAPDSWDALIQAAGQTNVPINTLRDAGLVVTNDAGRTYDRFRNRLIFPIRDAMGRTIAFGGRTLGDDPAKYLNSPETPLFNKSRILYGYDLARDAIHRQSQAVVVEGYMDAVLLHQHGFNQVVATLGTAMTDAHVQLLKPVVSDLVLCFDGDDAGQRAADRGVEVAVKHGVSVRVCVLDAGVDPADYVTQRSADALQSALSQANDALEFKWTAMSQAVEHGEMRSRRAAVEAFLNFVASSSSSTGGMDPIEQGLLVSRLSELLATPSDEIYGLLTRARRHTHRQEQSAFAVDEPEQSEYASEIRDLPKGLVAVVESLFELLLTDAHCFEWLDESFAKAIAHCEVWRHLFDVMGHLVDEHGHFTRESVIAECDESVLFELLQAARDQGIGAGEIETIYTSLHDRLQSELDAITENDLRSRLIEADDDPDRARTAFASLVEVAKRRRGFLSPKTL